MPWKSSDVYAFDRIIPAITTDGLFEYCNCKSMTPFWSVNAGTNTPRNCNLIQIILLSSRWKKAQLDPCPGRPVVRGNMDSNIIVSVDCKQAEVVKPGFSIDAVDKHGNLYPISVILARKRPSKVDCYEHSSLETISVEKYTEFCFSGMFDQKKVILTVHVHAITL